MKTICYTLLLAFISCCIVTCKQDIADRQLSTPALAKEVCGSCHLYPEPSLLNKTSWEDHVLPKMKFMLGFREAAPEQISTQFEEGEMGTKLIDAANVFHQQAFLSEADWQRIRQFYIDQAPVALDKAVSNCPDTSLSLFELMIPSERFSPPGTSLVQFTETQKLMVGDIHKKVLMQFDDKLKRLKSAAIKEGAVSFERRTANHWLTLMGQFVASDRPQGSIIQYPLDQKLPPQEPILGLRRPVHTAFGDLNNDGQEDLVVSEFGKWLGALSYWKKDGQYYERINIVERAGAIKSYIYDWDKDGLNDVIALFGQGDEKISIFYNQGADLFEEQVLMSFHPSMGSTNFELIDFDQDGDFDIVYTAGDNADFPPILKPYHGIRLFTNDGNNEFTETFFYPMYGAYAAKMADYDQDGDLDIAAISFFPDFDDCPEGAFIYLTNDGQNEFTASTFSAVDLGRWVCMDTGDYDGDGDLDIVLGSLAFEIYDQQQQALEDKWVQSGIPFIDLKNKLIGNN